MNKPTSLNKNLTRHNWTVVRTILGTINWVLVPAALAFCYYDATGDKQTAINLYLFLFVIGFGFAFPYWHFIRQWSLGKKKLHPIWEYVLRCLMFLLLPIEYGNAKKNFIRHHRIGQQLFFHDPQLYMLSEIERVQSQADLKVRLLKKNRKRDTAKERKRLEKLLTWAQRRKEKFYLVQFVAVARAISWHIREIEEHCHFEEENLTGLFARYKHAFPSHQQLIKDKYRDRMTPSVCDPQLPDISPKQSTLEGKLLYLAVLIRSQRDNHYDRLDFEKSDFVLGRYVYSQSRSAIDITHWQKKTSCHQCLSWRGVDGGIIGWHLSGFVAAQRLTVTDRVSR